MISSLGFLVSSSIRSSGGFLGRLVEIFAGGPFFDRVEGDGAGEAGEDFDEGFAGLGGTVGAVGAEEAVALELGEDGVEMGRLRRLDFVEGGAELVPEFVDG